jgi:hypothetical protein
MNTLLKNISVTLSGAEMALDTLYPVGHPSRETFRMLPRWNCAWLLLKDDLTAARALEAAMELWCAASGVDQSLGQRALHNAPSDMQSDALRAGPPSENGAAGTDQRHHSDTKWERNIHVKASTSKQSQRPRRGGLRRLPADDA